MQARPVMAGASLFRRDYANAAKFLRYRIRYRTTAGSTTSAITSAITIIRSKCGVNQPWAPYRADLRPGQTLRLDTPQMTITVPYIDFILLVDHGNTQFIQNSRRGHV